MKNRIIKTSIVFLATIFLCITFAYGWLTNKVSISENIVVQNGFGDTIDITLYRGYDYDFNGRLDDRTDVEETDIRNNPLLLNYIPITNANDEVSSIMEDSKITYRVVIDNKSDHSVDINTYFNFDLEEDSFHLFNKYKSILFRINQYSVIHNPSTVNESTEQVIINKSLCFYSNNEKTLTHLIVNSNEKVYLDFVLVVSNLVSIKDDLDEYLIYSQNNYYDLNRGLFINEDFSTSCTSLKKKSENETLDLNELNESKYVNLKYYQNNIADPGNLYTQDYVQFYRVYSTRQNNNTSDSFYFTLNQICFDVSPVTGTHNKIVLEPFNAIDLTNYSTNYNMDICKFYDKDGAEILSTYDISNGLYTISKEKIYVIYDTDYKYTLLYEKDIVIQIVKEKKTL